MRLCQRSISTGCCKPTRTGTPSPRCSITSASCRRHPLSLRSLPLRSTNIWSCHPSTIATRSFTLAVLSRSAPRLLICTTRSICMQMRCCVFCWTVATPGTAPPSSRRSRAGRT
uniref:(northern house mosquito) hypothetical protein n=1 Tax=Culex pipiens TaxID=7175 RepID=A0A8D8B8Y6_CULPI